MENIRILCLFSTLFSTLGHVDHENLYPGVAAFAQQKFLSVETFCAKVLKGFCRKGRFLQKSLRAFAEIKDFHAAVDKNETNAFLCCFCCCQSVGSHLRPPILT